MNWLFSLFTFCVGFSLAFIIMAISFVLVKMDQKDVEKEKDDTEPVDFPNKLDRLVKVGILPTNTDTIANKIVTEAINNDRLELIERRNLR